MKCGECTLCCKLLNIHWMNSPAGFYCSKCVPGQGCSIYNKVPRKCKQYNCMYSKMEGRVSMKFRPDNSHIIFEEIAKDIIHGLIEPEFNLTQEVLGQIGSFNVQGYYVVVHKFHDPTPKVYFPPHKQSEENGALVIRRLNHIIKSGSSIVHN